VIEQTHQFQTFGKILAENTNLKKNRKIKKFDYFDFVKNVMIFYNPVTDDLRVAFIL